MTDKIELKEIMSEVIEIICIINELLKIENMCEVDYSEVSEDMKWNKIMLRNRLDSLKEVASAQNQWVTAKEYMEKLDEHQERKYRDYS